MKVVKTQSEYSGDIVFDVPRIQILNTRNPLYIAAREGQKKRVADLIKGNGQALGYWELASSGYVNADGTLNQDKFREHNTIFVAEVDRVHDSMRPVYSRLLEVLETL